MTCRILILARSALLQLSASYLWGEHHWCNTNDIGQMWFFGCESPYSTSHLLVVNYDHNGYQTRILGTSGEITTDVAYEFYYSEV